MPIGRRLASTAKEVSRAFGEALAAAGGSEHVWLILLALKTGEKANQRALAAAVGIQGATLTHHLNGMEEGGLVRRRRDPQNRRIHVVELTPDGEAAFRRMEADATRRMAGRTRIVLSPGGGWITNPALLDALGPGTHCVWLQVSPDEAVRRSAAAPGERPLLAGADPLGAVRRLLAERERFYARAHLALPTDGRSVDGAARDIHDSIRDRIA